MSTESEVKLARYRSTEKEADAFGRIITVRRLRPSERLKVAGMASGFQGGESIPGKDGEKVEIPHTIVLSLVASVSFIDDVPIAFSKNIGELLALYDRLDQEGMEAALKAMTRLVADDIPKEDETPFDEREAAKNLPGTPSSA